MGQFVTFIVIGTAIGSIYGLAALGLVLTYKTSGVFNFAHGALATVAAYTFYTLQVSHGWPWPVAAAFCTLILGPLMGVTLEIVGRRIATASIAMQVACTVGILLVVESAVQLIYGTNNLLLVPQFLPSSTVSFGDAHVTWADIITFIFALAVTIGLSIYLRASRTGIAMRAVVDNAELLELEGTSPNRTRRSAWIVGSTLAAASGVLFAPLLQLDPVQLTMLVVAAFGAAAIGRFTSLWGAFAGGLVVGILSALATRYVTSSALSGLSSALPFLVLFAVLLVTRGRRLWSPGDDVPGESTTWRAPARVQAVGGIAVVIFLALVPSFAGLHLNDWTAAVATVITFFSLGLLVCNSGQVSLCQVAFTAIGAAAFSHLIVDNGVPWGLALIIVWLMAIPVGVLLAIPAVRHKGLYLALATFGFGILVQYMFYGQSYFFGSTGSALPVPRPDISWIDVSSNKGYYYLVLVVAVLIGLGIVAMTRTRLGRLLAVLSDSPVALASNGVSTAVTQTLVFAVASGLAAVGGALAAGAYTVTGADSYPPLLSLTYLVIIVIVPGRLPFNAVVAALSLIVIPSYISSPQVTVVLQLIFGASAVIVAMAPPRSSQVPALVRDAIDRTSRGRPTRPVAINYEENALPVAADGFLESRDVTVRFGGLTALSGVTVRAETGKVIGLIGPNGAGKTTMFDVCTGFVSPKSGSVILGERDVTHRSTAARARLGVGRTFQRMNLCETLTVAENVLVGAEGSRAALNPIGHLIATGGETARFRGLAGEAMRICGLEELADAKVASLPTGKRRLVEVARALAGPYQILLLDEPSSGLDVRETAELGHIIRSAVRHRNIGILLVEHDVALVVDICDEIQVLDFGSTVFTGTPAEMVRSRAVQAAYLGDTYAKLLEGSGA